jgi:hypothetical protein
LHHQGGRNAGKNCCPTKGRPIENNIRRLPTTVELRTGFVALGYAGAVHKPLNCSIAAAFFSRYKAGYNQQQL